MNIFLKYITSSKISNSYQSYRYLDIYSCKQQLSQNLTHFTLVKFILNNHYIFILKLFFPVINLFMNF